MLAFEKHLSTNDVWITLDGGVVGRIVNKKLIIRDIVFLDHWHIQAISYVMEYIPSYFENVSFKTEADFRKAATGA